MMTIERYEATADDVPELMIEIRVKERGLPLVTGFTTADKTPETWERVAAYVRGLADILEQNRRSCGDGAEKAESDDKQQRHWGIPH